jgi:hypothetical protein
MLIAKVPDIAELNKNDPIVIIIVIVTLYSHNANLCGRQAIYFLLQF